MAFKTEVFPSEAFIAEVAQRVASAITEVAPVMITGGGTVGQVYEQLAILRPDWTGIDVLFSDERAVPPGDEKSNYRLARLALFDRVEGPAVHRMRGEDPAEDAAAAYDREIAPLLERGIQLAVLGLGENAHIAGLFPGDPALDERTRSCVAVKRPDGMDGITLTPPALTLPGTILFVVAGASKAEAVRRAVRGDEAPAEAPVRLLDAHPDCTFLLDEAAASGL